MTPEELIENMERKAAISGAFDIRGLEADSKEVKEYSFSKLAIGFAEGNIEKYAPMEHDLSEQAKRNPKYAQATAPDSRGGVLVPEVVLQQFMVDHLTPRLVSTQLEISNVGLTSYPAKIPAITSPLTAETVAELQASGLTDMEMGELTLTPKICQVAVESSDMFLDMGANAENIIRDRMGRYLTLYYDNWLLNGKGAEGEPTGVLQAAGTNPVDFSGSTADDGGRRIPFFQLYEKFLEMRRVVEDADALDAGSKMKFCVNNHVADLARLVRNETSTVSGQTVTAEMNRHMISEGEVPKIVDYPYVRTTRLPRGTDAKAIFGAWDTILKADFGGMVLRKVDGGKELALARKTLFVAHTMLDYGHLYPQSFSVSQNLNTTGL